MPDGRRRGNRESGNGVTENLLQKYSSQGVNEGGGARKGKLKKTGGKRKKKTTLQKIAPDFGEATHKLGGKSGKTEKVVHVKSYFKKEEKKSQGAKQFGGYGVTKVYMKKCTTEHLSG